MSPDITRGHFDQFPVLCANFATTTSEQKMNFSTVIDLDKISAMYDNKSNNNPITVRFGFMFSFLILSRLY